MTDNSDQINPATHGDHSSGDSELVTVVESRGASERDKAAHPAGAAKWVYRATDSIIREVFGGHLETPSITTQSNVSPEGSYSTSSVANIGNPKQIVDRIILSQAEDMTDIEVMASIARNLVGLYQEHYGKPSRRGYKNSEWAAAMVRIGLIPSATDEIGGKQTGEGRIRHFIVEGGLFDKAAKKFLAREETVFYKDRVEIKHVRDEVAARRREQQAASKTKYYCATDDLSAWSRRGIVLICGFCQTKMSCPTGGSS